MFIFPQLPPRSRLLATFLLTLAMVGTTLALVTVEPATSQVANSIGYQFPQLAPGARCDLGAGVFDWGNQVPPLLPSGTPDNPVHIYGRGPGVTILSCSVLNSAVPNFALGNTVLHDMTIAAPLHPTDNCTVIGFRAQTAGSTPYKAALHNVEVVAPVYGIYNWDQDPTVMTGPCLDVYDSTIRFGRMGYCGGNSGYGQNVRFYRTRFIGDTAMSHIGGDTSSPVYGGMTAMMHRGGFLGVYDCETNLTGGPNDPPNAVWLPRCCTITDNSGVNFPPAGNTKIEVMGLRSRLNGNGATFVYDFDVSYLQHAGVGMFVIDKAGLGSGGLGAFTYSTGPAQAQATATSKP